MTEAERLAEFEELCEQVSQSVNDAQAHAEKGDWLTAWSEMQTARYLSWDAEKLAAKLKGRKAGAIER